MQSSLSDTNCKNVGYLCLILFGALQYLFSHFLYVCIIKFICILLCIYTFICVFRSLLSLLCIILGLQLCFIFFCFSNFLPLVLNIDLLKKPFLFDKICIQLYSVLIFLNSINSKFTLSTKYYRLLRINKVLTKVQTYTGQRN